MQRPVGPSQSSAPMAQWDKPKTPTPVRVSGTDPFPHPQGEKMARSSNRINVEIDLFDCDETEIIDFVQKNYAPEDVFSKDDLSQWATDNGFEPVEP
ncbi:MAG: hypothetical protein ABFD89_10050 [Bryobacteraceae bacterium]